MGTSDCLDEDDILAFASGTLESARRSDALVHLDECETCHALIAAIASESSPPPRADEEDDPDELIDGRFRLRERLGSGAMGTVYRAHDEQLKTDVALKLLHTSTTDADGRNAKAFMRELTVGKRVRHPNVCRHFDAGEYEDARYITMELVEGQTLAAALEQEEEMLEGRALEILRGIADGLAAVHAEGIVHRDLKPANVIIERISQRPVLTDFGFAAELDAKQSRRLVGTPSFWAPEQARGEKATPASDVYSLGLVAYRLFAHREFSLSDPEAMSAVPRRYRPFVEACLAARPQDRPKDAQAAIALLGGGAISKKLVAVSAALALAAGITVWVFAQSPGKTAEDPKSSPVIATPTSSEHPPKEEKPTTATNIPSSASPVTLTSASPPIPKRPPMPARSTTTTTTTTASAPPPPPREPDPLYRH